MNSKGISRGTMVTTHIRGLMTPHMTAHESPVDLFGA